MRIFVRFLIGLWAIIFIGNAGFFVYNLVVSAWGPSFVLFFVVNFFLAIFAASILNLSKTLKGKNNEESSSG
ncbi:hypothetical protein LCGC14_0669160 [marine sediment metagenome]|uniref:Uncharacterized protein n=1 Tax=marine sediment metagenome TaxID=412755 RepID=A0A0F9QWK6_9ZZZZ